MVRSVSRSDRRFLRTMDFRSEMNGALWLSVKYSRGTMVFRESFLLARVVNLWLESVFSLAQFRQVAEEMIGAWVIRLERNQKIPLA